MQVHPIGFRESFERVSSQGKPGDEDEEKKKPLSDLIRCVKERGSTKPVKKNKEIEELMQEPSVAPKKRVASHTLTPSHQDFKKGRHDENKGIGRKQALFDVLKRVEKVMARKKQQKDQGKPGTGSSVPNTPSTPAASLQKSNEMVMSFQSTELIKTMEDMAAMTMPEADASFAKKEHQGGGLSSADGDVEKLALHTLEYIVLEVFEWDDFQLLGDAALVSGMTLGDKLIRVLNKSNSGELYIKLRGSWSAADLDIGEEINIVTGGPKGETGADASAEGHVVLTLSDASADEVVLVRYPGRLVTGTRLSAATSCTRQAVLDEKVQGGFGYHPSAVLGSVKHEMIQRCMSSNTWTREFLLEQIDLLLKENYESLYGAEMKEQETSDELKNFIPTVQDFMEEHMVSGMADLSLQQGNRQNRRGQLDICEIVEIEDYLTSRTYGVKGIVDVSVKGKVKSGHRTENGKNALMPLEIKTGKEMFNHRAQLVVYVMLMEDAYREKVEDAVMWYTKKGAPTVIPVSAQERRHIIQARNYLAGALEGNKLPRLLEDHRTCSRCFQVSSCMGLHKMLEGGREDTSGIGDLFSTLTSHISPAHTRYFQKWYKALCLEEEYGRNRKKGIQSFHSIVLSLGGEAADQSLSQDSANLGVCYTFEVNHSDTKKDGEKSTNVFALGLDAGDRVQLNALSTENAFQINGRVHRFEPNDGCLEVILSQRLRGLLGRKDSKWRLSKDQSSSLNALLKGNLVELVMEREKEHVCRLRQLIIEKASPKFKVQGAFDAKDAKGQLNLRQKEAILSAINAEDYSLILGTPGSGKSTVIVELIQILLSRGKTVLVTSHTNTAVDNILARLIEKNVDFIRIGNKKSVSKEVQPYMIGGDRHPVDGMEGLREVMENVRVLGCTCYNMSHPIFSSHSRGDGKFDYCIVDEASQITLPAVLGPLLKVDKFVLVGDHYQLPPLVVSEAAAAAGLGRSLFEELVESQPEAVVFLEETYRFTKGICSLSSSLIYSDRLRCGSEGGNGSEEISFLDTDLMVGRDVSEICLQVVTNFLKGGIKPEQIGVITPYRSEVLSLKNLFYNNKNNNKDLSTVAIDTVDRFQGQEKDLIILSAFCRSNEQLLYDWRRVNVALTRAKHKLILIGSGTTLSSIPIFDSLLKLIVKR